MLRAVNIPNKTAVRDTNRHIDLISSMQDECLHVSFETAVGAPAGLREAM